MPQATINASAITGTSARRTIADRCRRWVSAWVELDLSFHYFVEALPEAVPIANLYIGLAKGAVFGLLIALIACHFGLRVQPNTESLSSNTTASVVSAITVVILVDAVFAIATRSIGLPA